MIEIAIRLCYDTALCCGLPNFDAVQTSRCSHVHSSKPGSTCNGTWDESYLQEVGRGQTMPTGSQLSPVGCWHLLVVTEAHHVLYFRSVSRLASWGSSSGTPGRIASALRMLISWTLHSIRQQGLSDALTCLPESFIAIRSPSQLIVGHTFGQSSKN